MIEEDEIDTESEVKEARLREELDENKEVTEFAKLLQDEAIRDFLWKIIHECQIFGEAWDPNFGRVGYRLGRQSIGKWLLVMINQADPQAWLQMQLKAARVENLRDRAEKKKRRTN